MPDPLRQEVSALKERLKRLVVRYANLCRQLGETESNLAASMEAEGDLQDEVDELKDVVGDGRLRDLAHDIAHVFAEEETIAHGGSQRVTVEPEAAESVFEILRKRLPAPKARRPEK